MHPRELKPDLDLLSEEFVLLQAWKKTAAHIRHRSWMVDTLALDLASINLPTFICEIQHRLRSGNPWQNDPLRIVPAPKSQDWLIEDGVWQPENKTDTAKRIRPLAYVKLADQVVATALMLCLADRVETRQGDPRNPLKDVADFKSVVSYGNRLFCDYEDGQLRHRWGSAKLYRAYYQDYQTFLSRSETIPKYLSLFGTERVIVSADLKQFYDRVRPRMLIEAIQGVRQDADDERFYSLTESVLDWEWDSEDQKDISDYAERSKIGDFSHVALPQGLVASGFFANLLLLAFDEALRSNFWTEIHPGVQLMDACRYVDDLQLLVAVSNDQKFVEKKIEKIVSQWLAQVLEDEAKGLSLSPEKTKAVFLDREEQRSIQQRAVMIRIQKTVSGGHDLIEGMEVLDGLKGLLRTQELINVNLKRNWRFTPIPDVRDETVARFSAARFLNMFRSMRPRLEAGSLKKKHDSETLNVEDDFSEDIALTKQELDESAKVFARTLIKRWIMNPSNIRVLLVGLDLYPDVDVLNDVLEKLRYYTNAKNRKPRKPVKQVAWYCLAEILRAGATHTGFVADTESLPSDIDVDEYRRSLLQEAINIVNLSGSKVPWYLRQQALLFLAAYAPLSECINRKGYTLEITDYQKTLKFLQGGFNSFGSVEFAIFAVLVRRTFLDQKKTIELLSPHLSGIRLHEIARRDPSLCYELIDSLGVNSIFKTLPLRTQYDLCVSANRHKHSLAEIVLSNSMDWNGVLRDEMSLLRFEQAFLQQRIDLGAFPEVITPEQVIFECDGAIERLSSSKLKIEHSRTTTIGSLYSVPPWCEPGEEWRFQLGFLLRFILARKRDFTRPIWKVSWREEKTCYRTAESHWYQRVHGLYSAQPAFGDDWLPITEWLEGFLLALLKWPGCRISKEFNWVYHDLELTNARIADRIDKLSQRKGPATNLLMLPMEISPPVSKSKNKSPFQVCVVQTAVPRVSHFAVEDLSLDRSTIRREHRNHLAATLRAVKHMHALRKTYKESTKQLDWLILPELAVHPKDVHTHLIPFARAHKTIILTGLTYEEIIVGQPLVNSALWIIPQHSDAYGLQIITRRQGKGHLAPDEFDFNCGGLHRVQEFRPCQWLIGFPWTKDKRVRPIWLTASVCYDATDLALVSDLRAQSDILAIPALNKDVKTFDQMAQALHYHMFQLIIVANNGQYGGSNAYWPKKDRHERRIFHTHGQPQVTISFFEIDNIEAFLKRDEVNETTVEEQDYSTSSARSSDWKYPPAGLNRVT